MTDLEQKIATIAEVAEANKEYAFRAERLRAHKADEGRICLSSSAFLNELYIRRHEDPQLFDEVLDLLIERYLAKIAVNEETIKSLIK